MSTNKENFLPFEEARKFVHTLNLKTVDDWREYYKSENKSSNIPTSPNIIYKNKGWINWNDWLGNEKMFFLSFEEARKFVHTLNLKTIIDWKNYCKSGNKPNNIPLAPYHVYKDKGWINWSDWFGYEKMFFLSFEEARKFVHTLNLKTEKEWKWYCKSGNKPNNIPLAPYHVYKDKGWINWGNWLGNGKTIILKSENLFSFKEARKFVNTLNLKSLIEWDNYCKSGNKPNNIPSSPEQVYKNKGWVSIYDWLGYEKMFFLSFEEAREFIHKLDLKSYNKWKEYCKSGNKPNNIPMSPYVAYKNKGWINWSDWLGNGEIKFSKTMLTFEDLKIIIRDNNIKTKKEYFDFRKKINE